MDSKTLRYGRDLVRANRVMIESFKKIKLAANVSPWIIIGAVAVLFPLFALMTMENISRQKDNSFRLLFEKGAALIRSFEAGTRMGMMGMHGSGFQLQRLLSETAGQSDIDHLFVSTTKGVIIAHNQPKQIGNTYGRNLALSRVHKEGVLNWRMVDTDDGKRIFQVYGKFSPDKGPLRGSHGSMKGHGMRRWLDKNRDIEDLSNLVIFVGLKADTIESARKADTRHTLVMASILMLVGFAGILFLFLAQNYKSARASLSRVKAFSDKLVENMPIGVIALDDKTRIALLNSIAETQLGISLGDAVGRPAAAVLPEALIAPIYDINDAAEVIEKEISCPVRGRTALQMEVSVAGLYDEKSDFLGHVILFKDLTEITALRDEVEKNRRLASVGRLAAGVAHEIRNPLSSIKGFATYFKEKYMGDSKDREISTIMIQEVDRLNRVVGQLLEFSKPIHLHLQAMDMEKVVKDSVCVIQRQAKSADIAISVETKGISCRASVDHDKINQVLLNLYLNAIEAIEKNGAITVRTRNLEDGRLKIVVSDTGPGIRPEDRARIFEPYFSTKTAGTGLGLAIVHNIIKAHNGEIRVDTAKGRGTAISILLPCTEEKSEQET